jgi:chromosome segregation ATPase
VQGQLRTERTQHADLRARVTEALSTIRSDVIGSITSAEALRQVILVQEQQDNNTQEVSVAHASMLAAERVERERAEQALQETEEELAKYMAQITALRKAAALAEEAQSKLEEAVTEEIMSLRETLEAAESHLEEKNQALDKANTLLEEAKKQLEERDSTVQGMKKQLEDTRSELDAAQQHIEERDARWSEAKQQTDTQIKQLHEALSAAEKERDRLVTAEETAANQLEGLREACRAQVSGLHDNAKEIEAQYMDLSDALNEDKKEMMRRHEEALSELRRELESEIDKMRADKEALALKLHEVQSEREIEILRQERERNDLIEKQEEEESELQMLRASIQASEEMHAEKDQEIERLKAASQAEASRLEADREQFKAESAGKGAEIERLSQSVKMLETAYKHQEEEMQGLRDNIKALQADLVSKEEHVGEISAASQAFAHEKHALNDKILHLEQECTHQGTLLSEAQRHAAELAEMLEQVQKDRQASLEECQDLQAQVEDLREVRARLCGQVEVLQTQVESERERFKAEDKHCRQEHATEMRRLGDAIADLQKRLDKAEEDLARANDRVAQAERVRQELDDQNDALRKETEILAREKDRLAALEPDCTELRTQNEALRSQIMDVENALFELKQGGAEDASRTEALVQELRARIQALEADLNAAKEQVTRLDGDLRAAEQHLNSSTASAEPGSCTPTQADLQNRLTSVSDFADALVADLKSEKEKADSALRMLDKALNAVYTMHKEVCSSGQSDDDVAADVEGMCRDVIQAVHTLQSAAAAVPQTSNKAPDMQEAGSGDPVSAASGGLTKSAAGNSSDDDVRRLRAELKKANHRIYAAEASASQSHSERLRNEIAVRSICEHVRSVACELAGVSFQVEQDRAAAEALDRQVARLARELAESDASRCRLEAACQVLRRGMELADKEFDSLMYSSCASPEIAFDQQKRQLFADIGALESAFSPPHVKQATARRPIDFSKEQKRERFADMSPIQPGASPGKFLALGHPDKISNGSPGRVVARRTATDLVTSDGVIKMMEVIGEHADAIQNVVSEVRAFHEHLHDNDSNNDVRHHAMTEY